jgi:type III pantothenate kinase
MSAVDMRILVDAGNTSTKWQLRSSSDAVAGGQGDLRALRDWVAVLDDSKQYAVAVSCVKDDSYAHEIGRAFESLSSTTLHFVKSSATFAGVRNAYDEPQRLGVDRWLALLAIKARGENSAVIIDVGTACTIDVLENGQHLGGYIFPGMALARDAMVANTDKIRFSEQPEPSTSLGTNTASCVLSGVWLTLLASCQSVIDRFPNATVYLTGGSAPELVALGLDAQRVDGLVFDGLDFWLKGGLT